MPHIKIEYSSNLSPIPESKNLLPKLHALFPQVGPFNISDIKSRITKCADFHIAEGSPNGVFVHCEISVLTGRTPEVRKELGKRVGELLMSEFGPALHNKEGSVTVEIREMDKETYTKILL